VSGVDPIAARTLGSRSWGAAICAVGSRVRQPLFAIGGAITAISLLLAAFGPLIAPYGLQDNDLEAVRTPPVPIPGSDPAHLLGTDGTGHDMLSQLIYAVRPSLVLAFAVVGLAGSFGVAIGIAAGWHGGRIDAALMRIADMQLAFPFLVLALSVLSVSGNSYLKLILVLSLAFWPFYARMARSVALTERTKEYVEFERTIGTPTLTTIRRYVAPSVLRTLVPLALLDISTVLAMEGLLSYIGLGIQPPDVSWGLLVAEGLPYIQTAWWILTLPGLHLFITALGFNLLGQALIESSDPHWERGRLG